MKRKCCIHGKELRMYICYQSTLEMMKKFMIKSSPAGGFNVYDKNDKFLSKFKQLKTAKLYYDSF